MALKALKEWFSRSTGREAARPLYAAIIAEARQPHWYIEGGVADTIDGRFDMINAVLSAVLVRMEALGEEARAPSALLAELFVDDMDGQLREIGFGDVVVGKHVGRMVGALGGRLGAYRGSLGSDELRDALIRNLYRGEAPAEAALTHTRSALERLRARLERVTLDDLLAGRLDR
jgi:cytochrome b pre-mRNA-processing protein 3